MFLIPSIYLFWTTLIILSAFTFIFYTPSIIGREFKNTLTWMSISGIQLILIAVLSLHSLIQVPLNMMLQLPLSCAIILCTKFYYSLFKYKYGRGSFLIIATNPLGADYRRPVRQSNKITCFNVRYYWHSLYQAKGDYAHLHQQSDKDLEDEVAAATAKVFYDDLLDLDIPYNLFLIRLPDPPDDALRSMLSLNLILFLYLYPVARGLILHWYRSISVSILDKYNRNVFCGMVYAVLKNA